ncbi:MAG: flavodoxin [Planctomycetota bacterium]
MTTKLMIVWGSTTGNTQDAAEALEKHFSDYELSCEHVDDVTVEQMVCSDVVLIGVSTWDIGELQPDWDIRVDQLDTADWSGVRVGFFGGGDAVNYADTFVDAFGILWERIEPKGAKLIGKWPTEGYDFDDSRSLCDENKNFLGLPIDDDNEPELTKGRIEDWAAQIRREIDSASVPAS